MAGAASISRSTQGPEAGKKISMTKVNPWGRPISPEATGKTVVRPRIASWASEAQARAAGQPEVSSWDKPPAQPSPWNRSANPYVDREQRQAREAYAAAEAREQELIRDLARHHVRVTASVRPTPGATPKA
jgi:hypothetical protein